MEEAELKPGERVLDVGCGPAYYLNRLPAVDYVGFDTCKSYVKYARRRSRGRGDFRCEFLAKEHVGELGQFDAVLLFGLLHHITDAECAALLDLCAGERRVSRWMSEHDRGAHVRRPEEYDDLASKCFDRVEGHLDDTLCRIPIALYLMRMTEPQVRVADPVWPKSSAREATREEGRW
jgi:SAM-dependent methyltransferase